MGTPLVLVNDKIRNRHVNFAVRSVIPVEQATLFWQYLESRNGKWIDYICATNRMISAEIQSWAVPMSKQETGRNERKRASPRLSRQWLKSEHSVQSSCEGDRQRTPSSAGANGNNDSKASGYHQSARIQTGAQVSSDADTCSSSAKSWILQLQTGGIAHRLCVIR